MTEQSQDLIFKGAITLGILYAGKTILEDLGLKKTAEEQAQQSNIDTTSSNASQSTAAAQNAAAGLKQLLPNKPALAWNRNYWKALNLDNAKAYGLHLTKTYAVAPQYKFSTKQYAQFAKDLIEAKKTWWLKDDDGQAVNVFRTIETQYQLSLLSDYFATNYSEDLLLFLKDFLDTANMSTILDLTNNYPKYYLFK